ncbi:MAG: class I SAM-dependent methyltransferase [Deltaproteobacteria bacterium]|nr:class I SAM-dependent methyltransferase [Deltaproteobacteria bacterium]
MGVMREVSGEYHSKGDYHRELDRSWRYYPVYEEKMAYVRRYLDAVPHGSSIVDVGCGEGLLVEEYRAKGYEMQGVDLNYASEAVRRGDITALPVDDASVDLALCLDVIEHLNFSQQGLALFELHRVLRSGGKLLLSVPNLAHFASRLSFMVLGRLIRTSSIERHPGDRPIGEYLKLVRDMGFKISRRDGIFPTYPGVSALTAISPRWALPLHRLHNRLAPPPGFCFLNMLELVKS